MVTLQAFEVPDPPPEPVPLVTVEPSLATSFDVEPFELQAASAPANDKTAIIR